MLKLSPCVFFAVVSLAAAIPHTQPRIAIPLVGMSASEVIEALGHPPMKTSQGSTQRFFYERIEVILHENRVVSVFRDGALVATSSELATAAPARARDMGDAGGTPALPGALPGERRPRAGHGRCGRDASAPSGATYKPEVVSSGTTIPALFDANQIMDILRDGQDPRIAQAFLRISGPRFVAAIPLLLEHIENDTVFEIRRRYPDGRDYVEQTTASVLAAEALGRIGAAAVPAVREIIERGNSRQRYHACLSAAVLHAAGHFDDAWPLILRAFEAEDNEPEAVAAYIRAFADPRQPEMVEAIAARLASPHPVVVAAACTALATLQCEKHVAPLLNVFLKHGDARCIEAAAAALRRLAPTEAEPALIAAFPGLDVKRMEIAAGILAVIDTRGTVEFLLKMLENRAPARRMVAIKGLFHLRNPSPALLPIGYAYSNTGNAEERALALDWLRARLPGAACSRFADLLLPRLMRNQGEPVLEPLELLLLNASPEPGTRIALMRAMTDPMPAVRMTVVRHIDRFPKRTVETVLRRGLTDSDPAIRAEAARQVELSQTLSPETQQTLLRSVTSAGETVGDLKTTAPSSLKGGFQP